MPIPQKHQIHPTNMQRQKFYPTALLGCKLLQAPKKITFNYTTANGSYFLNKFLTFPAKTFYKLGGKPGTRFIFPVPPFTYRHEGLTSEEEIKPHDE
jgi:hypothetical protein